MMISGCSLVLFFFLVPMNVLSLEKTKECGEDVKIPTSWRTSNISAVRKKKPEDKLLLSIDEIRESSCTENEKFCIQFGEGRTPENLTMHSVTFEDQGTYALYYGHDFFITENLYIEVTGMCEPKLSSSTDKLTCEVDVENPSITTIVWMDKHRKIYKIETDPENVTDKKLRATLKLTDETREMEICCTASYVKEGKKVEKQNCQIRPSHVGSGEVNDTDNKKKIIILPILCVLGLAIGVTLYLLRRRRMSFTKKSRGECFTYCAVRRKKSLQSEATVPDFEGLSFILNKVSFLKSLI